MREEPTFEMLPHVRAAKNLKNVFGNGAFGQRPKAFL